MRRRMSCVGMLAAMVFVCGGGRVSAGRSRDHHGHRQGSVGCRDCQGAGEGHQPGHQRRGHRRRRPTTAAIWSSTFAPGEYLVQVEAAGFQRFEQTVSLELGARSRLDVSLAVGSIGETVTVDGVTPLLSTESAVLGTVVEQNEVAKLPLAIRNWDDLLSLVPGVQSDRYTEQAGGTSAGRTGGVSVHGNRSLQNNFLLDGVANNSFSTNVQELTTQLSRPSVDAINEFKVVTSPYAAEYGWSPGAAIIVNTKSGTNAFHGTAYDFFRNESLDSNNFFAKRANQAKPTNNQNQFGGNLGGPIVRNRAFFFADVEATRIEQGVLRTGRVLTADERRGVFSSADSRSADRAAVPEQHHSHGPARPGGRANRGAAAVAERVRRQQLHPPAQRRGRVGTLSAPRRPAARPTTTSSRATSTATASATCRGSSAASSTARRRRPGAATTSTRTRWSLGWTKVFGGSLVNEARFSYATRHQRRHAGSVRRRRQRADRIPRRADRSDGGRRHRRHRHRRDTSGSGRRTSCRSSSTPTRCSSGHADVAARRASGEIRRRRDGADEQRVLRRRADARQPDVQRPVHRQRAGRLHARLRAARAVDQRVRGRPAAQVVRGSTCRTTGRSRRAHA